MNAPINRIGQQFGQLTIVSFAEKRNGNPYWNCQCTCGNIKAIAITNLLRGGTRTCGCGKTGRPPIDLAGQRFGCMAVQSLAGSSPQDGAQWHCTTACGKQLVQRSSWLRRGKHFWCTCSPNAPLST